MDINKYSDFTYNEYTRTLCIAIISWLCHLYNLVSVTMAVLSKRNRFVLKNIHTNDKDVSIKNVKFDLN